MNAYGAEIVWLQQKNKFRRDEKRMDYLAEKIVVVMIGFAIGIVIGRMYFG